VPPLRDRKEDITTLANYFVSKHSNRIVGEEYKLAKNIDGALSKVNWDGNVRQLEHFIIRAIVKSDGSEIKKSTIDELLLEQNDSNAELNSNQIIEFKSSEKEFKRQYFISLLKQTNGCVSETARVAGLTRQAVYKILNELNIEHQ